MMTWDDLDQQLTDASEELLEEPNNGQAKGRVLQTAFYMKEQMGEDLVNEWFDLNPTVRTLVGWKTKRLAREEIAQPA